MIENWPSIPIMAGVIERAQCSWEATSALSRGMKSSGRDSGGSFRPHKATSASASWSVASKATECVG